MLTCSGADDEITMVSGLQGALLSYAVLMRSEKTTMRTIGMFCFM